MSMTADDTSAAEIHQRVTDVLALIRPSVQADGGDIELVSIAPDGVVSIRFHGACIGCPSRNLTLQMGIESNLRAQVPQVTKVVSVG